MDRKIAICCLATCLVILLAGCAGLMTDTFAENLKKMDSSALVELHNTLCQRIESARQQQTVDFAMNPATAGLRPAAFSLAINEDQLEKVRREMITRGMTIPR